MSKKNGFLNNCPYKFNGSILLPLGRYSTLIDFFRPDHYFTAKEGDMDDSRSTWLIIDGQKVEAKSGDKFWKE